MDSLNPSPHPLTGQNPLSVTSFLLMLPNNIQALWSIYIQEYLHDSDNDNKKEPLGR